MSKTAKTTKFLMECIADALLALLQTKPISKITVDEITLKAGVGRATYFRNFHSKEEVISYKIQCLWEKFCEENQIFERNKFDLANAQAFFEYNYSIRKTLDIIYNAGLDGAIFECIKNIMLPHSKNGKKDWYRELFYSYGLFGLLDGWIRRNYKESPKEMAAMTIDIIQKHELLIT